VRRFEAELYKFLDNSKPDLLKAIREKRELNDEIKKQVTEALKEFKERFQAPREAPRAEEKKEPGKAGPDQNGRQPEATQVNQASEVVAGVPAR
jgi:ATP synthase alpha/beta chain, C terminal domain